MKHLKYYGKEDPMWEDFLAQEERWHEVELKVAKKALKSLKAMTNEEMDSDYFYLNNLYKKNAEDFGLTPETRQVWQACDEYLSKNALQWW